MSRRVGDPRRLRGGDVLPLLIDALDRGRLASGLVGTAAARARAPAAWAFHSTRAGTAVAAWAARAWQAAPGLIGAPGAGKSLSGTWMATVRSCARVTDIDRPGWGAVIIAGAGGGSFPAPERWRASPTPRRCASRSDAEGAR
jgi:hypothetical protein